MISKIDLKFLLLITLTFFTGSLYSQSRRVEIVQANSLEGIKKGNEEVRRLRGDVIFRQGSTLMYCDSALFYENSNSIDAFGNIRIEGPDAKMSGRTLHYNGNTRQAVINDNVQLTDGKMTLTTSILNYNTESDIADYNKGARVVDHENVLTSNSGYYYARDKMVFFKDNVILTNPDYIVQSDTLKYNTITTTASFYGPCYIFSTGKDSSFIYCEYGWYETRTGLSYFSRNAYIQSKENRLNGDSILYDRNAGLGRAFGNVEVTDTIQKIIVTGEYASVNEKTHRSLVTGRSQLVKIFETDSMYMHADTLYATEDTLSGLKTYFAYRHVRLFKSDMQGKCDSLVYSSSDSSMRFYIKPVLWSDKNQLTADSMSLVFSGNKLYSMLLRPNAFITSGEDSLRFNQVKGRYMTGYFNDNQLYRIDVNGNGQTIYYLRNKKDQLTGVNQADCSDMIIFLDSNKVQRISLINQPDATLFPVKETNPKDMRLKGYQWLEAIRPASKDDIFIWK